VLKMKKAQRKGVNEWKERERDGGHVKVYGG
jgi:hypothetical protein